MPLSSDRDRPWWLLPQVRVPGIWWLLVAVPLLWLDYATGVHYDFPMVYIIPVLLAAWYSGRWPAVALGVIIPLAQCAFVVAERPSTPLLWLVALTTFRGAVILVMALWFARLSEHERNLQEQVQTLTGLLPICSFCKSIRNDAGEWEHMERYISRRSETQFSHGICPSCYQVHYADLIERERGRAG
jgi:K+-sensing histidine kinase KdpD